MSFLDRPYIFDIILSDFGREAAIKYLQTSAIVEKRVIQSQTKKPASPFFDEYRRIMFVLVGDLAFFKKSQINSYVSKDSLDQRILIGIGEELIPEDVEERITKSILEQVYLAVNKGYYGIRVIIPCNTLTRLEINLNKFFSHTQSLIKSMQQLLTLKFDSALIEQELNKVVFKVCTIPAVVANEIYQQKGNGVRLN